MCQTMRIEWKSKNKKVENLGNSMKGTAEITLFMAYS